MLRFTTSGESHGKALVGIVEGIPSGVNIDENYINQELARRQKGYGRGGRMKIEEDTIEILGGVRNGKSLGSPISFVIRNRDYDNWKDIMGADKCAQIDTKVVKRPRPGHADLPGAMKYNHSDMRNVLERASARETAARVAAGAIFKCLLKHFNILIYSGVLAIGEVQSAGKTVNKDNIDDLYKKVEASPVRCLDETSEKAMMEVIDAARQAGESVGGTYEVGAIGVLPGLGSHVSWDTRLDSVISGLLMSIPGIKAVEIGEGISSASMPGSNVHDEIFFSPQSGIYRKTNRAGGIEGGISNGETIWARAYMKPIPTLYKPLTSVNTDTWAEEKADIERSDICAVPAASVVGEAMMAFGIARAFSQKFAGDSMEQIEEIYINYINYLEKVWQWKRKI